MLEQLREHLVELQGMELRLQACLADVRAAHERTTAELAEASRIDLQTRPLGAVPPSNGYVTRNIPLEEVRDAVVRLGSHGCFTVGELKAELGCSTAKARVELGRVMHLVKLDGSLGGRQLYTYSPPDGPGAAFEAQRRLRKVDVGDQAAAMVGEVRQSLIDMVKDKELKKAVREAVEAGWELVHTGARTGHPLRLVHNGCRPITVVSSPRDSDRAAYAIRRQVKQAAA